jgi:hypothetical protein
LRQRQRRRKAAGLGTALVDMRQEQQVASSRVGNVKY